MPHTDHVRFGILLDSHRDAGQSDADVLHRGVAIAQQADTLGVDDLWVTEHHFVESVVAPSALALAAYLLGRTTRIRVGTAVALVPLHPAIHVAEQAALLDQVSGGRFMLGLGRGQPLREYDLFGPGITSWRQGLSGSIDDILTALGGTVPGGGAARVVPRPSTPGGPPVYLAANSRESILLAAAKRIPMLLHFDKNPGQKAEMIAEYERSAGPSADVADHAFAVHAYVSDTADEAREVMAWRAADLVRQGVERGHLDLSEAEQRAMIHDVTERILDFHPVGDAATCVRRLVDNIDTSGCTRVLCQVEPYGRTADAAANVARLAAEVFPQVRAQLAGSAAAAGRRAS